VLDWLRQLSAQVRRSLEKRGSPPEPVLRQLLQTMYFSSLSREEAQPIAFHIVYMDPGNPDPTPPPRIVEDRWAYARLSERVPFDTSSLTKLAKASDPRSSSLAVYHDSNGRLFVWGLVDQGNRYFDFITYNSEEGPERPGVFQASIIGPGHIRVFCGYELIADFKVNETQKKPLDAFGRGPVRAALDPAIQRHLATAAAEAGLGGDEPDHWREHLAGSWITAVRRLLLRIQQYGHGGSILLTPDSAFRGLNVKYGLEYSRLRTSLLRGAVYRMQHWETQDEIDQLLDDDVVDMPVGLYLDDAILENDLDDVRSELDGVLWFVSLLSRVDGLVLMTPDLDVHGFGVEMQTSEQPEIVYRAGNATASPSRRSRADYNHFGTRHRSMMRYCAARPGSVGLVVSQDGDVRAMTSVDGALVMWENLQLRFDDFDRRRLRSRAGADPA